MKYIKLWTLFYLELVNQRHFVIRPFVFFMMALIYLFLIQGEPASFVYAPKVLILLAVLALLTGIEHFFAEDWDTGRLELWLVERVGLEEILLRRLFIFGILSILPLLLLLALFFSSLSLSFPLAFVASFVLAGITVLALGSLLSALLLGVQRPVILAILLMLPLMLPEILLTLGTYEHVMQGESVTTLLCLQSGITCVSLAVYLLVIPAVMRWSLQ